MQSTTTEEYTIKNKKTILKLFIGIVLFFFILGISILAYQLAYAKKVYPGVYLNGHSLGGMEETEVKSLLTRFEEGLKIGFTFTFEDQNGDNQTRTIAPGIFSYNTDIPSSSFFSLNTKETFSRVFLIGRGGTLRENLIEQLQTLISKKHLSAAIEFNFGEYEKIVSLNLEEFEIDTKNAELLAYINGLGKLVVQNKKESPGRKFDRNTIMQQVRHRIQNLSTDPIRLELISTTPDITLEQVSNLEDEVERIYNLTPITVSRTSSLEDASSQQQWLLSDEKLLELLNYQLREKNIAVGFDEAKTKTWLENIAKEINIEPKNAKFKLSGDKVIEFQESFPGQELNVEQSYLTLNHEVSQNNKNAVELVVDTTAAEYGVGNVNELGINERIGIGISNFTGSPANRRHNITTGSAAVNGLLIAPGEEFSMLQALGEIDSEHGYLPELVIKGNKTTPEFGGGLCQTSTTMFRAALNAGLKVTERRNHSYTVRYYYEDGVPLDATIYSPKPDFRFINDTQHFILIQTHINGDELQYEFWGTKDGRVARYTKPIVYNIVSPPPTRYIETTDIEPGKTRCTEISHNGLSTSFDYTIQYSDGKEETQTFQSVYRPWQAVCLVGVEKIQDGIPSENESDSASVPTQDTITESNSIPE